MDIIELTKNISLDYENAVSTLLDSINSAKTLTEVRNFFTLFCHQFTMLPALWIKWIELEAVNTFPDFDASTLQIRQERVKAKATKHFYHSKFVQDEFAWRTGYFEKQVYIDCDFLNDVAILSRMKPTNPRMFENALLFPHWSLKYVMNICERYATKPISSNVLKEYCRSKDLRKLVIKNHEFKTDLCENFTKLGNREYVIKSYECRLGHIKNSCLKNEWRAYIKFLQSTNTKHFLLTVFSRYCRLFVEDVEMKEEYLKEILKFHDEKMDVFKWWIDIIEFDRIFVSKDSAQILLNNLLSKSKIDNVEILNYINWFNNCKVIDALMPYIHDLPGLQELEFPSQQHKHVSLEKTFFVKPEPPISKHFSIQNAFLQQEFHFPFNYMNYLRLTSNSKILQKLFQSCKYFFTKSKTPLCHRLGLFSEEYEATFFEQSLFLNIKNLNNCKVLDGITVTNLLQVFLQNAPNATSLLLKKKIKCKLEHLELLNQNLTDEEFNLLAEPDNNIKSVRLSNIKIFQSENEEEEISFETIVERFHKACRISITTFSFTPETAKNLLKINRAHQNLYLFSIGYAPETFTDEFFVFVQKNAVSYARICVEFDGDVSEHYKTQFAEKGKQILIDSNLKVK